MIRRLLIENYILIEHLDIAFEAGLNIVTGETGAGKSILLGAISLLQGGRADVSALRDRERNCVVEGTFDLKGYGLAPLFEEYDLEYEDECVVRRVLSPGGKSRAYINDLPAPLTALRRIGERLVDIHSQHQTLLLGDADFQTGVVDSVSDAFALREQYALAYGKLKEARRALKAAEDEARRSRADEDYIRFQYEQLSGARLVNGEQEELESEQKALTHAAEIKEGFFLASELLGGGEDGVTVRLKNIRSALGRLTDVYPAAAEMGERVGNCLVELQDIQREAEGIAEEVNLDPERLDKVAARLDLLYGLQQKHQVQDVAGLIALRDEYGAQLNAITGSEELLSGLKRQIETLTIRATALAEKLTAKRRQGAATVEKAVREALRGLGMADAVLKIEIGRTPELTPRGLDEVRYLFCANRGGRMQPIEKAASGGEMSRLMLALKSLMAAHSQLPTIVFDEIDTGVSGAVADRMGEIIEALAGKLQVINITHLPQVAAKGRHHFFVYKETAGGQTHTRLRKLTEEERVAEIAQMISGSAVTEEAFAQARILLRGR